MAWWGEGLSSVHYSLYVDMPVHTSHTHSLPVMWRGTCFFSLDYVVYMYIFIMLVTMLWLMNVVQHVHNWCCKAKYVTKQQSIPSCNFVDYYMCGHLLYHYPQHTHTLCVCAGLYFIEDLCSLPFCAIVRVSCVVCVATRQLRYKWS